MDTATMETVPNLLERNRRNRVMANRDAILQQALALPPDDRAFVATALEQSLAGHGDPMSSEEFLAELRRRSAAYRTGTTTARPAAEVLADLRRRHTGEPT
jgi:putative addiction module component (TIGR02574 family)